MNIDEFSEWLLEQMEERHLNCNKMAAMTGLTPVTIGYYITGTRSPTIDAVPVVRCKDCFYGEVEPDDNSYFFCTHPLHKLESHESSYFCADGGNDNDKERGVSGT